MATNELSASDMSTCVLMDAGSALGLTSLVKLERALRGLVLQQQSTGNIPLWIVTPSTHALSTSTPVQPLDAGLDGLLRAAHSEAPQTLVRCVELHSEGRAMSPIVLAAVAVSRNELATGSRPSLSVTGSYLSPGLLGYRLPLVMHILRRHLITSLLVARAGLACSQPDGMRIVVHAHLCSLHAAG